MNPNKEVCKATFHKICSNFFKLLYDILIFKRAFWRRIEYSKIKIIRVIFAAWYLQYDGPLFDRLEVVSW